MITLLTSNAAKYAPFADQLERLRIQLESPKAPLPEIQTLDFAEALAAKARRAAERFGRAVLVDDAGLTLEAYPSFPGPLSSVVIQALGVAGLRRLLAGLSERGAMECHIGGWFNGVLRSWSGRVQGHLNFSKPPADPKMILTEIFVPETPSPAGALSHRERALAALANDIFELHLDANTRDGEPNRSERSGQCVFCDELEDETVSVFGEILGDRLASRIVYEDEHFVVMPPLGEFMEGGLLLLARPHIPSFAFLPDQLYEHLERLLGAIGRALTQFYEARPLVFEHGPASQWSKGGCCVDHAHLNIFPARVDVHPHLAARMSLRVDSLAALARFRPAEFGYLFVQENDGSRRVYDGRDAPAQLVRRIVTSALGRPERGDWRDYPGCDELIATCKALRGRICL
ncbi:hypothetical protein SBV1_140008 [Verrucomicrobia bacterium]|nr:hypothetical protein SBV1_140008 [Verrucomicrobiota bacterium]